MLPVSLVVTPFGGQEDTSRDVGKPERHCGKTAATRAAANVVGHRGNAARLLQRAWQCVRLRIRVWDCAAAAVALCGNARCRPHKAKIRHPLSAAPHCLSLLVHCFHGSSVDVATSAFSVSTVSVLRARFFVLCNLSASLPGTPRSKMR